MDENKFVFERLSKKHKAFLSIANPKLPLEIRRTLCPHISLLINSYKKALRLNVSRYCMQEQVQDINKLVELNKIFVALNTRIKGFQSRWNGSYNVKVGTFMYNHAIMLIDYYEKALSEIFQAVNEFVHSLNDDIHTKEQVQLVVRLFPQVLTSEFQGCQPIQSAVKHMRSVVFVPLLANKANLDLPAIVGQSVERKNANADANTVSAQQSTPSVITDSSSASSRFSNQSESSYSIWQWLAVSNSEAIQDEIEHDRKYLATIKALEIDKVISKADLQSLSKSFGGVLSRNRRSCQERFKYILESSTESDGDVGNTAKIDYISQLHVLAGSKASLSAFDEALLPGNRFPGMRKKNSSTNMRCVRKQQTAYSTNMRRERQQQKDSSTNMRRERQQQKESSTNMRRERPQEVTPPTVSSNRIRKRRHLPRSVLNSSMKFERYLNAELAVEADLTSHQHVA
jgi:hypothetical protein